MTPEQKAAFIQSQAVCAMAEIAGMQAANTYREMRGETIAYDESSFGGIADQFGISHNAVLTLFRD